MANHRVRARAIVQKRPKSQKAKTLPKNSTFTVVFTDAQRQRSWIIIIGIILCEFRAVNQS